jgi:transcriptional regulator with XRE-family HTH domain
MPGKPDKRKREGRVSQRTIAEASGVNEVYVNRILKGIRSYPEETIEKVLKTAEKLGYKKTENPNQHFNSTLTQEKADAIVEGVIHNKSLQTISQEAGLTEGATFKYIRGVKVPIDYPETEEEWRKDVTGFMEVAIWKGTKRLAETSINYIDDRTLPIAIGVTLDKLSTLKGQPTSIHLAMTASVNHRDLMKDLKERDVTPVNEEQLPDAV